MSHNELRNLRVLLVVEQYNTAISGGRAARHLAQTLRKAGAVVCVYCMSDWRWDTIEALERDQIHLTLAPQSGRLMHIVVGSEVARFKSLLSEFKPDVVEFCSLQYAKSRFMIQAVLKNHIRLVARPWIYDFFCAQGYAFLKGKECSLCAPGKFYNALSHGCGLPRSRLLQSISRSLLRRDILRFDCFLSSSQAMDRILTTYGVNPKRILRGPVPFDPQRITPIVSNEGEEFIFYGQLKDFKGAYLLPDIIRACPTVKFFLAPTGASEKETQKFLNFMTQMPNVLIDSGVAWGERLARRVADSRGILIPSLWPMAPEYVLMEALGLGKPIVAFDIGVHRDVLVNRQNAMVVPSGDWNAFAAAVRELDYDAQLRYRVTEGCRRTFQQITGDDFLLGSLIKAYISFGDA